MIGSTARYLTLPVAIVLSVVVRHGNVPTGSSLDPDRPSLTLECFVTKLLDVLKDTILQSLCANRFSVSSAASAEIGNPDLEDPMGAVKERRIAGCGSALSGVEGAVASAIAWRSMR